MGLAFALGKRRTYIIASALTLISFVAAYYGVKGTPIYVDEYDYNFIAHFLMQGKLAGMTSFQSLYNSMHLTGPTVILPWGPEPTGEPWLDHPFLFPLILIPFVAADLPPRTLPIVLSSLVTPLLFVLLRRKIVLAVAAGAIWIVYLAFTPVLSMLFLDTGASFFSLVALVFASEYLNAKRSQSYLYCAAIFAGLAAASKESGACAVLFLGVFVLILKFHSKESLLSNLKPFLVSFVMASAWYVFALAMQPALFLSLLKINTQRYQIGNGAWLYAHIPYFFISQANLSNSTQLYLGPISPLMVLGVVGFAYLIVRPLFTRDLVLPPILASMFLAFIIYSDVYFQTIIPLFPFYCIGTACIVYDLITKGKDFRDQRVKRPILRQTSTAPSNLST